MPRQIELTDEEDATLIVSLRAAVTAYQRQRNVSQAPEVRAIYADLAEKAAALLKRVERHPDRLVHTVRGEPIGPEGLPYGTTHDMDCPGCQDTPFTASPRSETYWSS